MVLQESRLFSTADGAPVLGTASAPPAGEE